MSNISTEELYICIIGMCLVSYGPRVMPFLLLGNREMPKWFERWLRYVPTSVFGALIFVSIFQTDSGIDVSLGNISMLAAIPVLVVAAKTNSLPYSIITGLVIYWGLQQFWL